jgi:hypothetical protein
MSCVCQWNVELTVNVINTDTSIVNADSTAMVMSGTSIIRPSSSTTITTAVSIGGDNEAEMMQMLGLYWLFLYHHRNKETIGILNK